MRPTNTPQKLVLRNILVIKLRYIGDVLLASAIFPSLKMRFPQARVVALVNPGTSELLRHNHFIDDILIMPRSNWRAQLCFLRELRSRRFDCVIDLTDGDRSAIVTAWTGARVRIGYNNEKRWRGYLYSSCIEASYGAMHMVEYHGRALAALGVSTQGDSPRLFVTREEEDRAKHVMQHLGLQGKRWIMLHPAARYWFKAWPTERFAALGDVFVTQGYPVVVIGKDVGHHVLQAAKQPLISLVGRTSLLELAALMKQCALFIGNDVGPMHMAAAVGCPVVALFGPTDPAVWGPRGTRANVIYKGFDCRACFHSGCTRGEQSCMNQITVDEVLTAAKELL